jgi:small conductance mechanosensitive channel
MLGGDNGTNRFSQVFRGWDEINFVLIVLIIIVAAFLFNGVKYGIPWVASRLPERFRFYLLPWVPMLRVLVLAVAIAQVTPLIINPTPQNLFAFFGAAAVAIGFAFKDYVSSIIAGIVALFEQPYRVGDWIEVDGDYGEVQSIGLRAINIVTPDDTVVAIPHSKMWNTGIKNDNAGKRELMCVTDFYLHPDHEGRQARHTLWDVALTSPYLQMERPVVVIVYEKPWGTHYRVKAYPIDARDQFLFMSDITVRGKEELRKMGARFAIAPAMPESGHAHSTPA